MVGKFRQQRDTDQDTGNKLAMAAALRAGQEGSRYDGTTVDLMGDSSKQESVTRC